MKSNGDYIITGGIEGKNRLNLLSEVLYDSTKALLQANGIGEGMRVLDAGCGGGNVSFMMAAMVGPSGHVLAIDFDEEIIALNRKELADRGTKNLKFEAMDSSTLNFEQEFDLVYARFLLSHLADPLQGLKNMVAAAKPGARVVVEDIQFSGHFCYPACTAFDDYVRLYTGAATRRGHNAEIGPELFSMFHQAGLTQVGFGLVQPAFHTGAGKWMAYVTMDKIKDSLRAQSLAGDNTIGSILAQLEAFTKDEQTIISLPRIFKVWGTKAA